MRTPIRPPQSEQEYIPTKEEIDKIRNNIKGTADSDFNIVKFNAWLEAYKRVNS